MGDHLVVWGVASSSHPAINLTLGPQFLDAGMSLQQLSHNVQTAVHETSMFHQKLSVGGHGGFFEGMV